MAEMTGNLIMRQMLFTLLALVLPTAVLHASEDEKLAADAFALFSGSGSSKSRIIEKLVQRGKIDAAPVLIMALRFASHDEQPLLAALRKLTATDAGDDWADWMRWQEAHPEAGVMPGFAKLQARVFDRIDPNFQLFLSGREPHSIRLEEITWGGVRKDGIPALTNPKLVAATDKAAAYLTDDELVFGVAINGDVRAYPLRILDWHEMFNDVVGGEPVSLAYCTLCGSGIFFSTRVGGQPAPLVFGSSGFLYRSNKLMYDTATHSLWNQFTGKPVVGPLTNSGIELKSLPVAITRWRDWRASNPSTKVLSLATGHSRDYRPGAPYGDYFASPDLMFPTNVDQRRLKQKDFVFALRSAGPEQAWPLKLFDGGAVINDRAGIVELVLIGDSATRTVRAYRSDGIVFAKSGNPSTVEGDGVSWRITEEALIGPNGKLLTRLPGHIAYWFAWSGYFGAKGTLAGNK